VLVKMNRISAEIKEFCENLRFEFAEMPKDVGGQCQVIAGQNTMILNNNLTLEQLFTVFSDLFMKMVQEKKQFAVNNLKALAATSAPGMNREVS
jgi:hypothetical protein